MARPSENLSERITVRLRPEEKAKLQSAADIAAVDIAVIARAQITGAPLPRRKRRASVDTQALARVLVQLGRIGTNINQIAKVANTSGDLQHFTEAMLLKAELEDIRMQVREALTP